MPPLTRRRDRSEPHRERWLILFGDVEIGHIGRRAGVPTHAPPWAWSCGFYPGCEAGEHRSGVSESFEAARAAFEAALGALAATKTENDYAAWRSARAWHLWKDRMHDEHLPLPTQRADGRSRCFCGMPIALADTLTHIERAHAI